MRRLLAILFVLAFVGTASAHHMAWHNNFTDQWAHQFEGEIDCGKLEVGIIQEEMRLERERELAEKEAKEQGLSFGTGIQVYNSKIHLNRLHRLLDELCREA